jgi:hypothetical protein
MVAAMPRARSVPGATTERLLTCAARDVQVLGTLTPVNAQRERQRLVEDVRAGRAARPRWVYAPVVHDELRRALDATADALERQATDPIERLYVDRLRELSLEAALCASAGSAEVGRLAGVRYASRAAWAEAEATALCARWLEEPEESAHPTLLASDSLDPRSLLSRMRAAVGRARLPFTVAVHPSLAPLAATGDRAILVAPGRLVSEEDVERTVLHEIEGHAWPRARAVAASLAIFRAGTARGMDDQEGRALLLEERAGWLGARRRRSLAARHRAFEWMRGGATFGDVASRLTREHHLDALPAVLVAERTFRGGDGERPGLGRERVYLESFVRLRAHLGVHPGDDAVLAAGQIAVDAAEALRTSVP